MSVELSENSVGGSHSEPLARRFRRGSLERQDSLEDFVLAPGSPLQKVPNHQSNGVSRSTPRFLDKPQPTLRGRSISPTPPGELQLTDSKNKKHKGKSHFNMFRLHRHKNKSKKGEKEKYEEMLSQSAGSALRQQKQAVFHRRSYSGCNDRPDSPARLSVSSFQGSPYSEGESEDELLKTLTNPSAHRGHSPSPLLRTPTPYQPSESDGGTSQVGGDNLSISPSIMEGENMVEESLDVVDPTSSSHQYLVSVTLHSGHNLAIRDRTGTSDPYVKFKCGRFKYRSAVIHRNLNPEWNESFTFKSSQLDIPLRVRVYDHDFGSLDDFMGGQTINLTGYVKDELQMVELGLEDPVAEKKGESLGFIRLFIRVSQSAAGEDTITPPCCRKNSGKEHGAHLWSKVLNVTLLEGKDLPAMDDNGLSDPYCKFKLGPERFESSIQSKTLNPRFFERFMLHLYDHDSTMLHIEVWDRDFPNPDDYIGSCSVNLSELSEGEVHDLMLNVFAKGGGDSDGGGGEVLGTIQCLLQISSTNVEEESERNPVDMQLVSKRYSLLRTADAAAFKNRDIGHLRIKVERAEDLPPTDSYVVVKVGCKCVAQTNTIAKCSNPEWNQTFHFKIEDVNDELEVLVYKAKSEHMIGKIKLPLHRLESGVSKDYALKKYTNGRTKGVLYLSCDLVYHPVRAGIRVFTPKDRVPAERQKLQTKVLMNNIRRVMALINVINLFYCCYTKMWSWEDKRYSVVSLIVFSLACLFGQLWIGCLLLVLLFFYYYIIVYARGRHIWQLRRSSSVQSNAGGDDIDTNLDAYSDFSDLEDELESQEKTSLRGKIKQFQYVLVVVQDVLGVIGDYGEKIKNLFNWSVPFLSWTAISVLLLASLLFYFVPLRYIILIWGLNKFSKRLRNPQYVDNNEITDFLSRCPTNQQLDEWREYSTTHHVFKRVRSKKARKNKMKQNTSDTKLKKRAK